MKTITGPLDISEVRSSADPNPNDWLFSVLLTDGVKDSRELWIHLSKAAVSSGLGIFSYKDVEFNAAYKQVIAAFCYELLDYYWDFESEPTWRISSEQFSKFIKRVDLGEGKHGEGKV